MWRHDEQENVLLFARKHGALNGRADRDDFIRIHRAVRLFAEVAFHDFLNLRDARRAADENDFVDVLWIEAGVFQRLLHRLQRPLDQVVDELLEFRTRQRVVEVLRTARVGRDERKIDVRRHSARQFHLRLFAGFLQALQRHRILREVDTLIALELRHDPIDDALIEVVAAEVGIAVRRLPTSNWRWPSASYSSRTEMSYVPPPSRTRRFSRPFSCRDHTPMLPQSAR